MADLEVVRDAGILWLTLNRPEQMGALTVDMRNQMIDELWRARGDVEVRGIVIGGKGKGFCTGADLSQPRGTAMPATPWAGLVRETMRTGSQRLLRAIWEIEKPVIASVNGTAAGLGAHLALVSDLILCAEGVRFIEVFVRRGIAIDAMGGYLLPRVMPLCKAKELAFFGDAFTAEDALALGVVNRVVPADQLETLTREWAQRLVQAPTFACGVSKRLLNRGTEVDLDTSLDDEALVQSMVMGSEDAQEGMNAFRERRPPAFKGR
ncbi:MAG: enoyl-CoA hydratase/isomerase family protein [Deltaproteobacteria bacterium]|nr:enoyl-CoA hydratase/isomerase family protein [Deltaproteobacteria bacterium]